MKCPYCEKFVGGPHDACSPPAEWRLACVAIGYRRKSAHFRGRPHIGLPACHARRVSKQEIANEWAGGRWIASWCDGWRCNATWCEGGDTSKCVGRVADGSQSDGSVGDGLQAGERMGDESPLTRPTPCPPSPLPLPSVRVSDALDASPMLAGW